VGVQRNTRGRHVDLDDAGRRRHQDQRHRHPQLPARPAPLVRRRRGSRQPDAVLGKETRLPRDFIPKDHHFTKTGSGQT
jgi:hypothetical protein